MTDTEITQRDQDELIAQLKGERGTALQLAAAYKAQRDLAWAEIDRLKALTRP